MKTSISIDVGPHIASGEANHIVADVYLPASLADDARLFFCTPGGGMGRDYYDLGGEGEHGFSFARAMTGLGHAVITIDPVGVGESTRPENAFALNSAVEAELDHKAFAALRDMSVEGVPLGGLPVVGTGHSAGALLTILQHANFGDFDALLLLCFGTLGLPQHLPADYLAALDEPDFDRTRIVEMARRMFGGDGYGITGERPSETPAAAALRAAYSALVTPVGLHAMTPGNVRQEISTIDRPVFLVLGESDMTGPPNLAGADYKICPDFTRYVLPKAGHHPFIVPTREAMFDRIARWAGGIGKAR